VEYPSEALKEALWRTRGVPIFQEQVMQVAMIAAGFSYQVVVAHNGCLQMEVTVHGDMAHAALPDSGTDALQAANHILNALYALNRDYL
ncbi:peptidase dimerization domain-containing protein, partial [Klebsiella pneumoniae]|uniref:peptidase dimerization domain-containing protein n=1 Tax=Klebsiella pneumoniae TaxID=573 RepID=UPI002731436B